MLVVERIRAAGAAATPCSLMVGTASLDLMRKPPASLDTVVGLIRSSSTGDPLLRLSDGGGAIGNLNAGMGSEPILGDPLEPPRLGVFGMVDARPFDEPLEGGYEALKRGDGWEL